MSSNENISAISLEKKPNLENKEYFNKVVNKTKNKAMAPLMAMLMREIAIMEAE